MKRGILIALMVLMGICVCACGKRGQDNGSSHYQFRKNGEETITIPFARPVKAIYVKMVLKALEK